MHEAPVLSYQEARPLIKNGDLLSFKVSRKNRTFLHDLTKAVTRSHYYHSGIAVWMFTQGGEGRLFICEAHREGRRLVPLSMYSNVHFDVTVCPVEFSLIEKSMLERVGTVPYGFLDYITVGLRMTFGISAKNDEGAEICSEMAQNLFSEAGFKVPDYPMAPNELKDYVNYMGYSDRVQVR